MGLCGAPAVGIGAAAAAHAATVGASDPVTGLRAVGLPFTNGLQGTQIHSSCSHRGITIQAVVFMYIGHSATSPSLPPSHYLALGGMCGSTERGMDGWMDG